MSIFGAKETPPKLAPLPLGRAAMSDTAAAVAQHLENLEHEIAKTKQDRDDWKNRAAQAEAACENLHDDLANLRMECDKWQRHAIEIMTKLRITGKIVLDAMQEPIAKELKAVEDSQAKQALAAVEKAIAEPKTNGTA